MRNTLILTAFLGLSFVQCTKADEPPPKYPDASSFCKGMADSQCNATVITNCALTGKDTCVAALQADCLATYVTQQQADGLIYDNKLAEACVNEVGSAYNDAKITAAEEQAIAEACGLVYGGTGAKGSTCSNNADCKQSDGLRCVAHAAAGSSDAGAAEGTCQVPVSVAAGNSCSAVDAECADGYHCGSSSHCDADGKAGDQCDAVAICATGFQCLAAKCTAKTADGLACTVDNDCANGLCITAASGKICASVEILSPSEPFCAALH